MQALEADDSSLVVLWIGGGGYSRDRDGGRDGGGGRERDRR